MRCRGVARNGVVEWTNSKLRIGGIVKRPEERRSRLTIHLVLGTYLVVQGIPFRTVASVYVLRHGYLINVSTEGCDLGLVDVDRAKIWI